MSPTGVRFLPAAIASLVFLTAVLCPGRAEAQAPAAEEPELSLEEVVVTASRLPDAIQELRRVPGQVYVVTGREIQRTKPRTVPDAIRDVPGVVLYNLAGNPHQPTVDLRGFNGQPNPSISVFVDGVRVNEPDSNAVNWDLIPIQDVDRIEVLPGATAVFGRDALGGVINIITKRGTRSPQTTLEGALGSDDHYRLSGTTSGPVRDFDYYLGLSLDRESGFREASDSRLSRATGRLGYRPSEATDLSLGYSYVNDRLEEAGSLRLDELVQDRRRNPTPGSLYSNELSSVTVQGTQRVGWGVSLAGNAFYRQTSREGVSVFSSSTGFFRGITDTDSAGGTLQVSHEATVWERASRFVVGGEFEHGGVNTSSGGTFGPGQRLIDEDAAALYAQETFDITPVLTLTGAVRYDSTRIAFGDLLSPANDGARRFTQVTPRAGLTYTPWPILTLYANYGRGYRVPTTDELFAFAGFGSNPNLNPVKSQTYEAGLRARPTDWVEATAAIFLTDVTDEIFFVADPTVCAFCGQNENGPKTRRQGVELTAKVRPHERVDVLLTYTYTDVRFRQGAVLSTGTVEKGDRVPLVPLHRASGTVTYRPFAGLALSLNAQYVSRQVLLNDEANQSAFRIQDALLVNADASYTWKQTTWFLRGYNLTNRKYETFGILSGGDVYLLPAPGINVLGGVTVRFEGYY